VCKKFGISIPIVQDRDVKEKGIQTNPSVLAIHTKTIFFNLSNQPFPHPNLGQVKFGLKQ